MSARCVMVLGTSSGAGKSWIATALCRHYANQGLRVAPFKAQNMSNNARVVPGLPGEMGEIGAAQYFQALAARAVPDVRMNPLLLKPEADTHSQVVLLGQVSPELTELPWRGRSERVWPQIAAALDALRAENDVVVIEGAGSPAEINLMGSDVVNLRVARHADARCLLVADIDRGGAFAHLYGTWALLPEADRARIAGFVLNKFRGDATLLAPAPEQLQELTGVPTVAVVPMRFGHGLPEEDGVFDERVSATLPLPLAGEGAPSPAGGGLGWGAQAPIERSPPPPPSPEGRGINATPHATLPSSPIPASATWTNSSRSRTCLVCTSSGRARRPICMVPTPSSCPAAKPPLPIWPGFARRVWMRRSRRTPRVAGACLASAVDCRCWAKP